ncbi:MAG: hypothetical protein A3K19_33610 [Lentisphaerae bacterium RIFOXYB12_FULL_65_16]|nr:MAG: hypothetical protein A3K19_27780 [Lentisphaerae bacterium RIFOXYB12_FULL_65_16]OGV95255.1 MAG: hypothetical protein A3K19_33610 [Lentisphaerae bacterium RIFOXYB12_FULL_65_16]
MLPGAPESGDPSARPAETPPPPSRRRAIEDGFCAGLVMVLIGAGLLAVLRRFAAKLPVVGNLVLSGSLNWPEPLSQHLVLWVALFGACAAAADRRHIAIDALSYVLSERKRRYVGVLTNLTAVAVGVVFAWLSVGFVAAEFKNNPDELTFFGLHACWLTLVLPVGFSLLAVYGMASSVADIRALFRPPPAPATPPPATPAQQKDTPTA